MQESINQQKASIDNLQVTFEEKFEYLQDQFSAFTQNCEEPRESQPMRQFVKKDLKRVPSLSSLNASLSLNASSNNWLYTYVASYSNYVYINLLWLY